MMLWFVVSAIMVVAGMYFVRTVLYARVRAGDMGVEVPALATGFLWGSLPFLFELGASGPFDLPLATFAGAVLFIVTAGATAVLGRGNLKGQS